MSVKIPIGIDDFRELRREGYAFVDKSFVVRDVIENGSKVLLLPRPRRFGKTLNLSMLRCFFDRAASDARALFEGLTVAREGESVWQHANRYPVLAMTFKEARASTWDATHAMLRERVAGLFLEHREVLEGGKLGLREERVFRRMLDGSAEPIDYWLSLEYLSRALHAHHGKEVVILIDEYDAPIHAAYVSGYLPQALDFFRMFLGAGLKGNPHLRKGVLTGILRIARENIFSGLNNLDVFTLLTPDFRTAFGFTEPEVKDLLGSAGLAGELDVARQWYNGYLFGGEVIYNPWSVLNFVNRRGEPAAYWLNTSSNELVRDLLIRHAPVVQSDIEALLAGGSIERRPEEAVVLTNLESDPGALWSLLLFSGYLKAARVPPPPGEQATYQLSIPNLEVRQVYLQTFADWLRMTLQRRGGSAEALVAALLGGDAQRFEAQLSALALETLSYHDMAGPEPERFYQGLMIGLMSSLLPDFEIRSNREAGKGRADMLFRPRRPGGPGVVLELKVARSKAGLARALDEGMAQIKKMGYAAELASAGISPVHCVVVAFDGKSVRVRAAEASALAKTSRSAKKRPAPARAGTPSKRRAPAGTKNTKSSSARPRRGR